MKNIDLSLIERLAENMNENSLTEISLELGEQKLILKKEKTKREIITSQVPKAVKRKDVVVENKEKAMEKITGDIITSPMMGTFYRSPSPGASSFVEEGQKISIGETVCIIEAMKMMNEVISEFSGKVIRVLVEDGAVVQKGDKLFVVE